MKESIRLFLQQKTTIVGIMTAIMFQLIFSLIWMTGYDGVTDHTGELKLAVVNEDTGIGPEIVQQARESVPFQLVEMSSLSDAQVQLEEREVHMVVHIEEAFTPALQNPQEQAVLHFYINESNPSLIKSMMTQTAQQLTTLVNQEAAVQSTTLALGQNEWTEGNQQMAVSLIQRVSPQFSFSNPVDGMAKQMVPMMTVLASYVGSMLLALNLEQSSMIIGSRLSKWRKFAARNMIMLCSAFLVSFVGSVMVTWLGGQAEAGLLSMWLFQTLFVGTFMLVAQIFLLWFGMSGMLFNILFLSAQLVSSGAMVPRDLLSPFYYTLSQYLPATYAVEGNMNLLFGGPSLVQPGLFLLLIAAVALLIGAGGVWVTSRMRYNRAK
ncbi:YhgE/Pip domain-containing protein [Marinicrinis sediminis]|uniref:YhgE/Pip domain-containing protein n=1 Tax=Marinicrinis sediminis TaxID=1652465 RepID=A0ABW5RBV1_9BACL